MNRSMKPVQNLFTHNVLMIKSAVKELQSAKFYAILLAFVTLAGIFSLSPAISSLMNDVIIRSTGRIATPTTAPITAKSEIRGVFVHCVSMGQTTDWDVIADTLAKYKIDAIYGEFLGFGGGYYGDSPYGDQLGKAIAACHARGIEVWVSHTLLFVTADNHPELHAVDHNGVPYGHNAGLGWICPTKEGTREVLKAQLEEVLTNYDIDGYMFDYIRYDAEDMCYCNECRAKFEEWLGEGPITDWTPFYPGGARHNEFMEWRTIPVTELVRDMREWMLAIRPDLKFALAAWTLFQDCPTYWRYWIGQDTADWINKGYLDMVAPMMYTTKLTGQDSIEDYIQSSRKYMTGGVEGKIPLVPLITAGIESPVTVEEFKAVVEKTREMGADGWIIWRYGGPGDKSSSFDITPYLSALDLPDTFSLSDIQVYPSQTEAVITWTTDLPATSKVEYSSSPLFNATYGLWDSFHYWDVDHIPGTIIEDDTHITNHNITLTGLLPRTKYYFRVQSQDPSGIATSKVLTFTTGG